MVASGSPEELEGLGSAADVCAGTTVVFGDSWLAGAEVSCGISCAVVEVFMFGSPPDMAVAVTEGSSRVRNSVPDSSQHPSWLQQYFPSPQ